MIIINRFLNRLKKRALAMGIAFSLAMGSISFAMPEIMPLTEVTPGMTGKGYTIIDKSGEIKSFDVEVVGVNGSSSKLASPRILIDLSGEMIKTTGGIVSGMSGSPIYVDGKLIGAASASFSNVYLDKRVMVTPIEYMLKLWDLPDNKNKTQTPQIDLKKIREEAAKKAEEEAKKAEKEAKAEEEKESEVESDTQKASVDDSAPESKEAVIEEKTADKGQRDNTYITKEELEAQKEVAETEKQAEAPKENEEQDREKAWKLVSGFSGKGVDFLSEKIPGIKLRDVANWNSNAGPATIDYNANLEPGGAVGVAQIVGDYYVGAMGTVTAVDGKRILAFGHGNTDRGNVNYFMTGADVFSTAHGPLDGMKIGHMTSIIGRVNQDRYDGIAGILGEYPQNVPVILTVNDTDLANSQTYHSFVAYDEEVVPLLTTAMVYDSMYKTIDRAINGTAKVHFRIRTDMGENGVIERTNMFYNGSDVGKQAVGELNEILNTICTNKEREANIYDVKVDVFIGGQRMTASILSATPDKTEVCAGDKVIFKTTLKPYRQEKVTVDVPYTVPKTQLPGTLNLDLHGGGLINVAKLLLAQQAGDASLEEDQNVKTEAKIKEMLKTACNNDIVVEPAAAPILTDAQQKAAVKEAIKQSKKLAENGNKAKVDNSKPIEAVQRTATDYVIENVIHTTLKIVENKAKK
ncbi:SpoIVB peptidase S55 domain-containing protein [Anaerovibrio sp.]|uniref:SpoIVB peptidase S55 domain-containing protein n=1 Tax=Anaerovibrio sp. TaxID=1872532 RepID=UPI00389056B7